MVSEMELRMNDMLVNNPKMLAHVQLQMKNEQRLKAIQECVDVLNGILMDIEYAESLFESLDLNTTIRTHGFLDEAYDSISKVSREMEGYQVWEEGRLAPRQTCNRKPTKPKAAKKPAKRTKTGRV